MKTFLLSILSFALLSSVSLAQPTISNNEYYHIGDVFQMVNCAFTGFNAGDSGTGKTWDFSRLGGGGTVTMWVAKELNPAFATSNIVITLPNGLKEHVQENNTDSYVNGITDTITGVTTYYNNYDNPKRPVTYLSSYIDSFSVDIPSSSLVGYGYVSVRCDAYGTLILPNGTFNNVLRMRKYRFESDTVSSSYTSYTAALSYLWFDGIHPAPLLEIDSTSTISGATESVLFLATPAGVANVNSNTDNYSGYFNSGGLRVNGNFDPDATYQVSIINLTGKQVFREDFVASGGSQQFDISEQLTPGVYIVDINPRNDAYPGAIFKVVKN